MIAARSAALFASDLSSHSCPSRADKERETLPARSHDSLSSTIVGRQAGNHPADELLASVIHGDRAAWDEVVRKHERLVIATALRIGLSHSDAEDVAQLTWLRLWEHGHQIRQPERLSSWLASTARREAVRLAASSNRQVLCADPSGERFREAAVVDVYPVEQGYDWPIQKALNRLPALYRTLLRLLSSELELSYSEVAVKMGLPRGSIGPMRGRAIRMLEKTPEFTSNGFPRHTAA
jgi:RNA polymerase sigma factor (sigma-70 family)